LTWEGFKKALSELAVLLSELRGRGGLRHGLSYVRVSDIVEQSRCEARLEALLGGERVVDERARLVAELAELALGVVRRLPREPPRRLLVSTPVAGVGTGVPIVGRPRALLVEEGVVRAIVYASVSSRPWRLYPQDRVWGAAYCAALYSSPLPASEATHYIHVKSVDRATLADVLTRLRGHLLEGRLPLGEPGVHVLACDPDESTRFLEPLLQYWLGLREARRSPGPWCSECPLRGECRV